MKDKLCSTNEDMERDLCFSILYLTSPLEFTRRKFDVLPHEILFTTYILAYIYPCHVI